MDPSNSTTRYSPPLTASESSDTDEVNSSSARVYFGPVLSPEKKFIVHSVARRAAHKSGAFGTPVRRSPRLSAHPSPRLPSKDALSVPVYDGDDQDDTGSVNEGTSDLPGEDTPENDPLFQDEPSSVLASKIMRAFDNPSPPPRNHTYPASDYAPGKDGQFPLLSVSVPPSPFRSINLFERLNQLAAPLDDTSHIFTVPPSTLMPGTGNTSQHDLISFESLPGPILQSTTSGPPVTNPGTSSVSSPPPQTTVHDFLSETPKRPEVRVDRLPSPTSESTVDVHAPPTCCDHLRSASRVPYISGEPPPCQQESEDEVDAVLLPGTSRTPEPIGDEPVGSDKTKARCKGRRPLEESNNSLHHKLKSLSPQSADILTQLLPSSHPATQNQDGPLAIAQVLVPGPSTLRVPSPSPFDNNLTHSTIQRPLVAPTPVRPKGVLHSASPFKFARTLDETSRTPARRVPIHDAFANVTPSIKKTGQLALLEDQSGRFPKVRGDVFSRPVDVSRSPARRVPVPAMECKPSLSRSTASTCTHTLLRTRSASVEPRPTIPSPSRSRSVEPSPTIAGVTNSAKGKGPMFPRIVMTPKTSTKLPYPLIPAEKSEANSTYPIPEENEGEETGDGVTNLITGVVPSPHKSQLKQPSVGSRIPRIGAKPYARPRSGTSSASNMTSVPKPFPSSGPKPVPHARSETSHSNSDELTNQNTNVLSSPNSSALQTLKRKRTPGRTVNQPSSHPVKIRQVIPGMLGGKYALKSTSNIPPSEPNVPLVTDSLKSATPIPFRKVVDGMLAAHYPPAKSSSKDRETLQPVASPTLPVEEVTVANTAQSSPDAQSLPLSQTTVSKRLEVGVLSPQPDDTSTELTNDGDFESSHGDAKSTLQRPSRTRKPPSDVADVSGNNARAALSSRRSQSRLEHESFMGMSATALKALTSSNTVKNQQTVALFATEVIRKEGLRPESPTVKIRTIMQRQREEKDRQRKERAERRARRSDEGWAGSDTEGVDELPTRLLGIDSQDRTCDRTVTTYNRGPGDDEDYETPEKQRPAKRLRFGEDVEQEEMKPAKQVKWHRGLSTAVYLDDICPKPRPRSNHVIAKGCLAPSIKTLRLDTLGNITDIDNRPPLQLVQEPVVIKKYLYDNDIEPDLVSIPARTTRSKSKKAKT
ncbi:hypothetical protein V8B97DRAFT_1689036 [Scleroderma yunnanense]